MIEPVIAKTDAANVFTATQQIKSTDAGATAGPTLELYRDSASPAVADDIGQIAFQGEDSAGNLENYARVKAVITDPTSTSEDAKLVVQTVSGGTLGERVSMGAGVWTDGATGGDPGSGKVNATGYQQNGMALSPVVQVVNSTTGAVATGTTVMPYDDTIPQSNEGDQYLSLAITPKSATNLLLIEVAIVLTSGGSNPLTVALFQDATANALAAVVQTMAAGNFPEVCVLRHYMVAGTTSATTFKVRGGAAGAGTTTLNGTASARRMGGVMASSITITEIAA